MTSFTRIGASIWDWEPFIELDDPGAQLLWFGLYTTAHARRMVPGLWHGSPDSMAEATHRPRPETYKSLDRLLDKEMVEFDPKPQVLRMTKLPDAGEYPSNPNILRSWWSKFNLVPVCAIRDAHVWLLRWIMNHGSAKPTPLHEEVWAVTFGTITVPSRRRHGVRRMLDADTSTATQPSLFGSRATVPEPSPNKAQQETDNSMARSNDLAHLETVSKPLGEGVRVGEGEGVGAGEGVRGGLGEKDVGSREPERAAPVLQLVPLSADPDRERVKSEILAVIGPAHATAYNRARTALNSTARPKSCSVMSDFPTLRTLLNSLPSLDGVREDCEHAIMIREAEAIEKRTLMYFGEGMWSRTAFEKAISMEMRDVCGQRASKPLSTSGRFEPVDADEFGPTGDIPL